MPVLRCGFRNLLNFQIKTGLTSNEMQGFRRVAWQNYAASRFAYAGEKWVYSLVCQGFWCKCLLGNTKVNLMASFTNFIKHMIMFRMCSDKYVKYDNFLLCKDIFSVLSYIFIKLFLFKIYFKKFSQTENV